MNNKNNHDSLHLDLLTNSRMFNNKKSHTTQQQAIQTNKYQTAQNLSNINFTKYLIKQKINEHFDIREKKIILNNNSNALQNAQNVHDLNIIINKSIENVIELICFQENIKIKKQPKKSTTVKKKIL
jgi:hypothetical protein